MHKVSLLVIEDNPADVALIKEYLYQSTQQIFTVHEADTLQSAITLLTHHDFDVVLLDLQLPDSSGLETMRKIINELPETPVVILSGLKDENIAVQAVRYGAQDYLDKQHLSSVTLIKSLRYAIERMNGLQDKKDLLDDLALALQRVELLENLLPLCIGCNKIQGKDKKWYRLEQYQGPIHVGKRDQLMCPGCAKELNTDDPIDC